MDDKTAKRLHDAYVACEELSSFAFGKSLEDFCDDRMLQLAVQRLLEILGEAFGQAMRNDPWVAESFPDAYVIVGLRNRIIHGYDQISDEVLWSTVVEDIPRLQAQLGVMLPDSPDIAPPGDNP